jgi:hypothetical protein
MIAGAGAHPQWSAPIGAIMRTTRFKCPVGWLDRPLVGEGAPALGDGMSPTSFGIVCNARTGLHSEGCRQALYVGPS